MSGGGRKRARLPVADPVEPVTNGLEGEVQPAQGAGRSRRDQFADIARRRAAHFATFQEADEEEPGNNIHAGGSEARTLGPWSSAVALVNEREAAAERRAERLLHAEGVQEAAAELAASWRPSRDLKLGARSLYPVQPLSSMCLRVLVEYVDCVESLVGVPDVIRTRLAAAVSERRKLTPEVAMLFAADSPGELVLPNCTLLDRVSMVSLLQLAVTQQLERLDLDTCGRGFGDSYLRRLAAAGCEGAAGVPEEAAEALAQVASELPGGNLSRLSTLRLGGAYRLNDFGLLQVLRVTPNLRSLGVPDASRLTGAWLHGLPGILPQLRSLNLANCRGLDAPALATVLLKLRLSSITLDGISEVDDSVLASMGAQEGGDLRHVSLAMCSLITEDGVCGLAARLPQVESICLDKCDKVTDRVLEVLASSCLSLRAVSLMRVPKITDAGLVRVARNCPLVSLALHGAQVGGGTLGALASHCHSTLTHLDLSFCRGVSSEALGMLVDRCQQLTSLLVFGCSQLTNVFVHGHSNEGVLQGLHGLGTPAAVGA